VRVLVADLERVWRGGQEQALTLISGLERRGHEAELVAVRDSAIASRAQAGGLRVHPISDTARRIAAAVRLGQLLREARFDVTYANEAHALTAAWLARAHRHAPVVAARRVAFPLSRGRISLARYRAASRILAISEAVRRELLAAGLDQECIEVVPDGIEIPEPLTREKREAARERWGFRADESVLACVGALTAEKGHGLLIEAFAKMPREMKNCRLLIAGEGRLRGELEQKAQQSGLGAAIIFAGFVPDVDSVYAAGDLFVFPSLQEGSGTSLLRAMAYGLPALALARGGVTEIIEDGRNGILVQEANAEVLGWAAWGILGDRELRGRLSEAARETVATRYSADQMIEGTERIFEGLISRGRGHEAMRGAK
jgi:glycosyltransferase involved in cell wall biosynthesis